jgi:GNAT superfamily N-acetyltransferase
MTLRFRPMAPPDLDHTAALWHEGWMVGHAAIVPDALVRLRNLESFRDRLTKHIADTRVATQDGTIIGFAILLEDEIYQFYVGKEARGTGAATALMADAESQLRATGISRAWLACSRGNDRAARFYEKTGWRRMRSKILCFETSAEPFPLEIWRYEKDL